MTLRVTKMDGASGSVIVFLEDEAGIEHTLPLTVFDVSTLVSGLYATRAEALKQPVNEDPEVMLPIHSIRFGSSDDGVLMRVYVAEGLFQDYLASPDSPLATMMAAFSEAEAKRTGQTPRPFGGGGSQH